jgi:hypothetical protein
MLSIVGLSLPVAVERLVPDAPAEQRDAAVEGYRQAYHDPRACIQRIAALSRRAAIVLTRCCRARTCCLASPPANRAAGWMR